jgi:hypothetical protein
MTIPWWGSKTLGRLQKTRKDRKKSQALGMTKGWAVTFIRSRQIGWTERKSSPLRIAPVPQQAETGGTTILLEFSKIVANS